MRRLISRLLLVLAINLSVFRLLDLPLPGDLRLPAIRALLKIYRKNDWEFVVSDGDDRQGRNQQAGE
jgi:hypothetical protein